MLRHSVSQRLVLTAIAFLVFTLTVVCQVTTQQIPERTLEPTPSSTSTLEPSPTLTLTTFPTGTPTTTSTPTVTASMTPDKTATAQFVEVQRLDVARDSIQQTMNRIDLKLEEGQVGWAQEFPMAIELSEYDQVVYTDIAEGLIAEDFILKTDITWESTGGFAVCGFVFRLDFDEVDYYQYGMLRLSGLPAWSIMGYDDGIGQYDISGVRTSGAIDQAQGSTNQVLLIAKEGRFTLYINDQRIGNFYDHSKRFRDGGFAFVARQESGVTTCTYDSTWIWLLEEN